jgi:glycosyltransferase involved in cell wall biosynthesis
MAIMLTVAIPHYNNVDGLLATLGAISKQYCRNMEIVVSDNATGRGFEKVQRISGKSYPKVSLIRNKKNLGYDTNIEMCVRKSRGQFVWLLGSGDIPHKNAVKHLLKIIETYPTATSILLNVKTNTSAAAKKLKDLPITTTLVEPTKNRLCLSQLYRSALSGNVVNRGNWLEAARKPLYFKNWCHTERALQMHCISEVKPFSVNAECVEVFVAREDQGWWNYNNLSFLQNVLLHREILFHYSRLEPLKNHQLPAHCKPLSITVLKAILYSRSIATTSPAKQRTEVEGVLCADKIYFGIYKIIQLLPSAFVRALINSAKFIKRVS